MNGRDTLAFSTINQLRTRSFQCFQSQKLDKINQALYVNRKDVEDFDHVLDNAITESRLQIPQNDDGDIPIQILYESENVIAINKPPIIQHHNDNVTMGVLTYIRHLQNSDSEQRFPYQGRIYGVHRLDRETSGILLLAKTRQVAISMTKAFRENSVTKFYLALSSKKVKKKKQGWVKGDMVRARRGAWKLQKSMKDPAISRFFTAGLGALTPNNTSSVLRSNDTKEDGIDVLPKTLMLFQPHTGKTHQLRVAAKSMGLPILGDPYYKDGDSGFTERTYLHAAAFHVKLDEEDLAVWCPPPSNFNRFWEYDNAKQSTEFDQIVLDLLAKNCQCESILRLIQ